MSVIDATSLLAASTSKLRSTSVERELDPSFDLAYLAVVDPNGVDAAAYAYVLSPSVAHTAHSVIVRTQKPLSSQRHAWASNF